MEAVKQNVKLIIILAIIFFATGCDVTYNINLDNNTYKENIIILENRDIVNNYLNNNEDYIKNKIIDFERDYEYYKKEEKSTSDKLGYIYKYGEKIENFLEYSFAFKCYNNLSITYDEYITINTNGNNTCFLDKNLENLTINITTDKKVIEHNAYKVKDNVYTWNFSKNINDTSIYIKMENNINNNKKKKLIISITFFVLIVSILIIIKRKKLVP